jgi:hypothetical protein
MRGSSCIFTSQGWKDIRTWSDRRNPTRHKVQLDRSDVRDGVDRVRTHSRLATAASQQGAKDRVSRRGATEVDNGAQLSRVTVQECGWVKPKAGKTVERYNPFSSTGLRTSAPCSRPYQKISSGSIVRTTYSGIPPRLNLYSNRPTCGFLRNGPNRDILVRTCVLERVSDDIRFLRDEPMRPKF